MKRENLALFATVAVALLLYLGAATRYTGFASVGVALNLLEDNSFLGIAAVGMTFVILSGGIDLSVGSIVGFTSIAMALLIERMQMPPLAAIPLVLAVGAMFGLLQGILIVAFELAPFLVTLAGMFLVRGLAYVLSLESVPLTHPFFAWISQWRMPILGSVAIPPMTIVYVGAVVLAIGFLNSTRAGRSIYAFGGNAFSSRLMGLPVARTQILVYVLSGALAALAGVVYTCYTQSGNATAANMLELDAIAAVVIGGTLLSGGRGGVLGTFIGVLILGMIQTIITFESTLNSWWTKIIVGGLMFSFVAFQLALTKLGKADVRKRKLLSPKSVALSLLILCLSPSLFASTPTAVNKPQASSRFQRYPTKTCPAGFQAGRRLESGLYQLTGSFVKPDQTNFAIDEIPDPAPPFVNARGEVEIYGSANYFIRYRDWTEFETAGCFEIIDLELFNPRYARYSGEYTQPWDLRKVRVDDDAKKSRELLVGGAMTNASGHGSPEWPRDNISRRIYFFREHKPSKWLRDDWAIVGGIDTGWLGHSYGGNFIQEDALAANVISMFSPKPILFFYERVSEATDSGPLKTEIFARTMTSVDQAGTQSEIPILTLGKNPFPSSRRTIGGYLVEGPRPVQVEIEGQKFFLIGFSSGDFPTDSYTINFMWSRHLAGPYAPYMNEAKSDLEDFGAELKKNYGLSWVGRPSLYRTPQGRYELMFHAVQKSILPENDYTKWPTRYQLWEFFRSVFKSRVKLALDRKGEPTLKLDVESAEE